MVDEKQNKLYFENLDFYDFKKNVSNLRILINGVDKTRDVEYVHRKFSKINVKFLGKPTIYNYNLQNIVLKEDENVFNNKFKQFAISEHLLGKPCNQIFIEACIDISKFPKKYFYQQIKRWKKEDLATLKPQRSSEEDRKIS